MESVRPLAELAVEYWKLLRAFERTIARLPEEHAAKTRAQLRFSSERLTALLAGGGVTLVTFDGLAYEPNLPVTALNPGDFAPGRALAVEATVEPAIVRDMNVVLLGKVILKQREDGNSGDGDVSRD